MWFFNSPEIVFGEESLSYLENLRGSRAVIVTDKVLVQMGYAGRIQHILAQAGFSVALFDGVEPDPSLDTVRKGAEMLQQFQPDWIVGLGGGSCLDAAKAIWILYERPDIDPEGINPIEYLGLRTKARFVAIPTTSGTGSEATWAIVLTNPTERRKLGLGSREALADLAILDPSLVMALPPRLTVDTGLDALTHAIEGYTTQWHNDFSDGLCLKAAQLEFRYLPRAYQDGSDLEARTHLHNAACIAGLGFGNAMAALAHGIGHSLGAVYHIPHGRAVSMALPYTIEYCMGGDPDSTRYQEMAHFLGMPAATEEEAASSLVSAIRGLESSLDQSLSLKEMGFAREDIERDLGLLVDNASNDTQTVTSTRIPEEDEMRRLFLSIYEGTPVDY